MTKEQMTPEAFLTALEAAGHLTSEAVQRALSVQAATSHPVDIVMRELAFMPDAQLAEAMALFCQCDCCTVIAGVDEELLERIGTVFAQSNAVIPCQSQGDSITLIVADPFASSTIEAVSYLADLPATISVAPRLLIDEFFRERAKGQNSSETTDFQDSAEAEDVDRLLDIAREAPIVKFVSRILQRAVDEKATDVHIEPLEDSIRIRLRRDGLLDTLEIVPKFNAAAVTSRIKILSRLNISERRLPQDGRLRASIRGQEVDFRVSVMPSIHGETIVLRILDRSNIRLDLAALGYQPESMATIARIVRRPNGIMLLTGPTGSGKTTTLYSILSDINDAKSKIFTVEDPVEYRLAGVTQLQVEPSIGLTFATALRSVLRQDPDIILLGEIRDPETAKIAVQAALTGHLVLSTLHTNSAAGAINRLREMGVESYLLAATLRGIIGQRLLRKACPDCSGHAAGVRCETCNGAGYSGRRAVYEILEVTEPIREAIGRDLIQSEIENLAIKEGMRPLAQQARELVAAGITTVAEVSRVVDLQGE
ncbi:type II/IV secretion system protein (plasmid) [Rhizobium lusitanum]|uniref:GspE/PulE family protein n=1 Tax=Rhizobium lusitanum TaxID=293958 RepID=UPI00161BCA03|nr:GspE/PulE family protein [Rhizobium lusitanum]QND46476.1 type II/IV secretion system protein [Rhizobium lusitanum]